jgi:hypothetical protein
MELTNDLLRRLENVKGRTGILYWLSAVLMRDEEGMIEVDLLT